MVKENGTAEQNVHTTNLVHFIGSVIAKDVVSEDLIRLKIAVASSYEKNGYCIIPVCFYGREATMQIDQAIRCDAETKLRVELIGFVQTSKRVRKVNGATIVEYYQDVVGTSLAFAKTALEAAFSLEGIGKTKAASINQFVCFGRVVNTFFNAAREEPQYYLTVKTWHNDHANFPQMVCRGARINQIARNIHNDDYVVAIGELCPRKLISQGKPVVRAQLAVKDLQRIAPNAIGHLNEVHCKPEFGDIIFQKKPC